MIKVERLEMNDIINAPFIDRFVYQFMIMFNSEYRLSEHMTLNPLKWCVMTLLSTTWFLFLWLVIFPLVVLPCAIHSAHKIKTLKYEGGNDGVYQSNVWLLRPL